MLLGWIDLVEGDAASAERAFREAVRIFAANEDHGHLCEAQRALAEALLEAGQVDEAERHALAAHALVSRSRPDVAVVDEDDTRQVRAAQGRDAEAEELLRESLALLADTDYRLLEVAARIALTRFLRAAGRDAEAAELEAGLPSRCRGGSAAKTRSARPRSSEIHRFSETHRSAARSPSRPRSRRRRVDDQRDP